VYRNTRYTLDRGHPLQVPCGEKALNFTPKLFFCGVFRYTPAVVGMWESQRDFQKVWEGWAAGFLAFHAFHTLSFPWPTLETCIRKSKLMVWSAAFNPTAR
jgi:hypothetical protein